MKYCNLQPCAFRQHENPFIFGINFGLNLKIVYLINNELIKLLNDIFVLVIEKSQNSTSFEEKVSKFVLIFYSFDENKPIMMIRMKVQCQLPQESICLRTGLMSTLMKPYILINRKKWIILVDAIDNEKQCRRKTEVCTLRE